MKGSDVLKKFQSLKKKPWQLLGLLLLSHLLLFWATSYSRVFIETKAPLSEFDYYTYWGRYSESFRYKVLYESGLQQPNEFSKGFFLPLNLFGKVRLDTSGKKTFTIEKITLQKRNFFFTQNILVSPRHILGQGKNISINDQEQLVFSEGNDPNISLNFNACHSKKEQCQTRSHTFYHMNIIALWAIFFILWFSLKGWRQLFYQSDRLILAMLAVLLTIGCVAILQGKTRLGPDEPMHFLSAIWYEDQWLPPSLNDKNLYRNEAWGTNYLLGTSGDFIYIASAKINFFVSQWVPENSVVNYRLVQLFLCLLILGLTVHFSTIEFGLAQLSAWLLIPQYFYHKIYFNGGAISMAVAAFCLSFITDRFIKKNLRMMHFIFILFLLANIKLSATLIGFALVPIGMIWFFKDCQKKWLNLALAFGSLPVIFYRRIFNFVDKWLYQTSPTKQAKHWLLQQIENNSEQGLLWETQKITLASMEKRLTPLAELDYSLIWDPYWYKISLMSFVGYFGFFSMHVPNIIFWTCPIILIYFFYKQKPSKKVILGFLIFLTLNTSASLYYSITHDNQPQGRYFFASAILLLVLSRNSLRKNFSVLFVGSILTIYSLCFFLTSSYFAGISLTK